MKMEPHADIRSMALVLGQIKVALLEAGFTQEEAVELITAMIPNLLFGGGR